LLIGRQYSSAERNHSGRTVVVAAAVVLTAVVVDYAAAAIVVIFDVSNDGDSHEVGSPPDYIGSVDGGKTALSVSPGAIAVVARCYQR
jgi:hypothetical protein